MTAEPGSNANDRAEHIHQEASMLRVFGWAVNDGSGSNSPRRSPRCVGSRSKTSLRSANGSARGVSSCR